MKELLQKLLNERRRLVEEIAALKNRSDGLAVAIQILTEEMDAFDNASRERN
jgi:chorismate mutase